MASRHRASGARHQTQLGDFLTSPIQYLSSTPSILIDLFSGSISLSLSLSLSLSGLSVLCVPWPKKRSSICSIGSTFPRLVHLLWLYFFLFIQQLNLH